MRDFMHAKASAADTMAELTTQQRAESGSLDPENLAAAMLRLWDLGDHAGAACLGLRPVSAGGGGHRGEPADDVSQWVRQQRTLLIARSWARHWRNAPLSASTRFILGAEPAKRSDVPAA